MNKVIPSLDTAMVQHHKYSTFTSGVYDLESRRLQSGGQSVCQFMTSGLL